MNRLFICKLTPSLNLYNIKYELVDDLKIV